MKAAYIEQTGSPEVITIGELPMPTISEDQVLVKVHYVTVNHIDCYIRSGKYKLDLPLPYIIGRDFCGEVVEVGAKVSQFKKGDRVWSNCQGIAGRQGTFAEFLALDENTVFHLPANVSPEKAVGIFHAAFTAILGLTREAQLQKGQSIYVHGAAGSIGAAVIQVAKAMGARVIASTHGAEKISYCQQLGADEVIDYKEMISRPIKAFAPKGVDIFWNTSRIHDFKTNIPLLALKGRYILMAGSGGEGVLPIGDLYTKDASIRGFTISNASLNEIQSCAQTINSLLQQDLLQTKIEKEISLQDTVQAHIMQETDGLWGKLIVKIND